MDDEENSLFNINVSSSDDETSTPKVPRDFQSEEDFQRQRAEWRAPIETGQVIYNLSLSFPLIISRCLFLNSGKPSISDSDVRFFLSACVDMERPSISCGQASKAGDAEDIACY